MGLFERNKKTGGILNQIRCDEPSYLIWKWHPAGVESGNNTRENAIRWGSSLRVKDGEVAVFVYNKADGENQDFIVGPYDQIIETGNFPVLSKIIGLAYGGGTPFQAEIYFINLSKIVQVKFGVPFFDVFDPRYEDFAVPVAVRGTINFRISDYREFIKLHRLSSFSLDDFQKEIKDVISRYIKDTVQNAPATHNIPVMQLESKLSQINDIVEYDISERLRDNFGVEVSGVDIGSIEIDKSSEGYYQLMGVTKNLATASLKAESEAKLKDIADKQRIDSQNYEETLRVQREEGQYARHMNTRTNNFGVYQTEMQAEVGKAGAEALGQMGANGAGDINLGGNSTGINMAAMMASMSIGSAVGQNIANTMNNMMGGASQTNPGAVPPPIPSNCYHVAANGQDLGNFDIPSLTKMAENRQFTAESLVWKPGMPEWAPAKTIEELQKILANTVPPIPPQK